MDKYIQEATDNILELTGEQTNTEDLSEKIEKVLGTMLKNMEKEKEMRIKQENDFFMSLTMDSLQKSYNRKASFFKT